MNCLYCKKDISDKPKNKFCSRSCSVSFNNSKFPKRKLEVKWCFHCGTKLAWANKKFCNKNCEFNYRREFEYGPRFENGLVKSTKSLKVYLGKIRGNFCELCKCSPIHNGLPLKFELDHIDGNSDNNSPNNTRLVCPNCHSQLETSRGGKNNKKIHSRNIKTQERLQRMRAGTSL